MPPNYLTLTEKKEDGLKPILFHYIEASSPSEPSFEEPVQRVVAEARTLLRQRSPLRVVVGVRLEERGRRVGKTDLLLVVVDDADLGALQQRVEFDEIRTVEDHAHVVVERFDLDAERFATHRVDTIPGVLRGIEELAKLTDRNSTVGKVEVVDGPAVDALHRGLTDFRRADVLVERVIDRLAVREELDVLIGDMVREERGDVVELSTTARIGPGVETRQFGTAVRDVERHVRRSLHVILHEVLDVVDAGARSRLVRGRRVRQIPEVEHVVSEASERGNPVLVEDHGLHTGGIDQRHQIRTRQDRDHVRDHEARRVDLVPFRIVAVAGEVRHAGEIRIERRVTGDRENRHRRLRLAVESGRFGLQREHEPAVTTSHDVMRRVHREHLTNFVEVGRAEQTRSLPRSLRRTKDVVDGHHRLIREAATDVVRHLPRAVIHAAGDDDGIDEIRFGIAAGAEVAELLIDVGDTIDRAGTLLAGLLEAREVVVEDEQNALVVFVGEDNRVIRGGRHGHPADVADVEGFHLVGDIFEVRPSLLRQTAGDNLTGCNFGERHRTKRLTGSDARSLFHVEGGVLRCRRRSSTARINSHDTFPLVKG